MEICVHVSMCAFVHVSGGVIHLVRQVGCCEELIMVQQSGARRPCFMIMGFHRLQMEPRCSRREMGFHTQTRTQDQAHSHMYLHKHNQLRTHTVIHPCAYRTRQLYSKHIEKSTPSLPISQWPISMHSTLSQIGSQFLSLLLPYLCLSQLPTDKIQ